MLKRTQGLALRGSKGFTLLELLIVIAIIAILSVALILVLNPAETIRKSRDVQRISDLNTLKNAIGIYTTTVSPVFLSGASDNTECQAGTDGWTGELVTGGIFYSVDATTENTTDLTLDGATFTSTGNFQSATLAAAVVVDGTGWLPIKFTGIAGGSPIANLPQDPTNDLTVGTSTLLELSGQALVYRYACHSDNLTYEINANLESTAFTVDDNKEQKDGGNSILMYEVGTKLDILGTNSDAAANAAGF